MKKYAIIITFIVFIMVMAVSVLAQPQLTIPEAEFDFGYVPQHSKISHIFWLHSTGTDTLKIVNVRPG
jgi:hypothetical protein